MNAEQLLPRSFENRKTVNINLVLGTKTYIRDSTKRSNLARLSLDVEPTELSEVAGNPKGMLSSRPSSEDKRV